MSSKQKGKLLRIKAKRLLRKEHKNWSSFHIDTQRKLIKEKVLKLKKDLKNIRDRKDFKESAKKLAQEYNYENPHGYRNTKGDKVA